MNIGSGSGFDETFGSSRNHLKSFAIGPESLISHLEIIKTSTTRKTSASFGCRIVGFKHNGYEVARHRILVDSGVISGLVSVSFWGSKCVICFLF